MAFTRTQQQEAYKKLPPEAQNFVLSSDTSELITQVFNNSGIGKVFSTEADSEMLYAMYGLQTLESAVENISKLSGKTASDLSKMLSEFKSKIFDKLNELKKVQPLSQAVLAEETLKSIPEQKPETQEIAPTVVVEKDKPDAARPSINLIMPEPEEKLLEAPKPEASPVTLAPSQPVENKPANIVEEKLREVAASAPQRVVAYPDGKDPYREPTI
jgi:hypothetical protein